MACARRCSFWGKKNIPTPYSRSLPSRMFSSSATLEKNLWLICSRMPTPSPVLPSASLPARCSSRSTMDSASSTVWWLLRPLMSTTAPMPQASCSNCGSYRPRVVFCSVKFSIVFPILFTCLPGATAPSAAFYPLQKEKSAPQGHKMPLRNAFVPIPDIIQIPEKSSSDSCTKYATHIAPLLVRNAASPRSCARYTSKTAAPGVVHAGTAVWRNLP
jgi:hypothetical protein